MLPLLLVLPACYGLSFGWSWNSGNEQSVLVENNHLTDSGISLIDPELFNDWIADETAISFEKLVGNVGSSHSPLQGVANGAVIASPSKKNPDYFYVWTRDAAITMNTILHRFQDGNAQNSTLKDILEEYIDFSYNIQRTPNPSGNLENGDGLGEPKFNTDGSAFNKNWGRPQRDGPALRATTIMNYINTIQEWDSERYKNIYNNIVVPDLQYVARTWNLSGFDLWEEVNGTHFFTLMVQQRAMALGAAAAKRYGDSASENLYVSIAEDIRYDLETKFFDHKKNHVIETLNSQRSGLDCGIIVGSLYGVNTNNVAVSADNATIDTYRPFDDAILSTISAMVRDMSTRYPINAIRLDSFESAGVDTDIVGVGLGRYPEDVYNGVGTSLGNPWFLCTAGVSETMYILARHLHSRDQDFNLTINDINKAFYEPFLGHLEGYKSGFELHRGSADYDDLVHQIVNYGDSFLDVVRQHQDSEGNLSEQFNRFNGYMTGAEKLTWSFGQFYRATRQRGFALNDLA